MFDVEALITQADKSLQTALALHKSLKHYVICFPFDPTGKTARKTKLGRPATSESEKLNKWIAKAAKEAKTKGRDLTIELWPASRIQSLLLEHDSSGGMRHYFFCEPVLSPEWFKSHLAAVAKTAGPRYSPELSVETPLWGWFEAFASSAGWRAELVAKCSACHKTVRDLKERVSSKGAGGLGPPWPEMYLQAGEDALKACEDAIALTDQLGTSPTDPKFNQISELVSRALSTLRLLEQALAG